MNPLSIQAWVTHDHVTGLEVRWRSMAPDVPRNIDRLMHFEQDRSRSNKSVRYLAEVPLPEQVTLSLSTTRWSAVRRVMADYVTFEIAASGKAVSPEPFPHEWMLL